VAGRYVRFERTNFVRLLTADPPVCRAGRPLEVLANCERLRRGEVCWCRFEAEAIADDFEAIHAAHLTDWLTDAMDPADVDEFAGDIDKAIAVARATHIGDDDVQRVVHLRARLGRLVQAGAGLTDRYSDELDE
jgi:hypothetical protein